MSLLYVYRKFIKNDTYSHTRREKSFVFFSLTTNTFLNDDDKNAKDVVPSQVNVFISIFYFSRFCFFFYLLFNFYPNIFFDLPCMYNVSISFNIVRFDLQKTWMGHDVTRVITFHIIIIEQSQYMRKNINFIVSFVFFMLFFWLCTCFDGYQKLKS